MLEARPIFGVGEQHLLLIECTILDLFKQTHVHHTTTSRVFAVFDASVLNDAVCTTLNSSIQNTNAATNGVGRGAQCIAIIYLSRHSNTRCHGQKKVADLNVLLLTG